ncbi:MAG: hypothetical protein OEV42_02675 [Deltaproteobacteria bacterium]|nr:hypothetical protein [Deltaproteobacteria bacterium]
MMKMMKIVALAAFLTVVSYGSAFAAAVTVTFDPAYPYTVPVGTHADYNIPVKPSKNVSLAVSIDTNNINYVAGTCHKAGDKTFASSAGDTKIYQRDLAPGKCADGANTIPTAPVDFGVNPAWGGSAFTAI